jgi:PadR family transcriptional regulator AphA
MMKVASGTSTALLGLLSMGPMSGYDIRQLIPWSIGHFWSESYGQIYPALKRLAADGLVEKKTEQTEGRPDRNVYSLTAAGRKELRQWLAVPVALQMPRNELLLKLFFGKHAGKGVSKEHVTAFAEHHRAALAVYDATAKKLRKEEANDPQLPFWLMTLSYGRHQSEAALAWCEETSKELDRL